MKSLGDILRTLVVELVHQLQHGWSTCSVPKYSSGVIFVNIRAVSGQIFSKNPGKIRAKIRAKLKFCDVVVFLRFRARSTRYFAV